MNTQLINTKTNRIVNVNDLIQLSRKKSEFYKARYANLQERISNYEELKLIPYTESDDLSISIPPYSMLTKEPTNSYVFTSGGSTGEPKLVFLTGDELKTNIFYHGNAYKRAGITEKDIVGTFGVPGYLTSEFTVYLGLQHTGCLIVPLGINSDPEKILYYLKLFKVNTLLIMPSDIIPLIQYLESTGESLNIDKVIYGGEKLYDSTKEYIKRALNVKHFGAVYQSMDVGTIGYQCRECELGEYHLQEDLHFVEILDDESKLVEWGEIGELIITNLNRRLMPVIRYRTSDLARFLGRNCKCGDSNIKIKLIGRKGDFIKVGGERFSLSLLNSILEKHKGLTGIYQIELRKINDLDKLIIKIEKNPITNLTKSQEYKLMDEIIEEIFDQHQKIKMMLDTGVIAPIDITFVERDSLIFSASSGKVKTVYDLRK